MNANYHFKLNQQKTEIGPKCDCSLVFLEFWHFSLKFVLLFPSLGEKIVPHIQDGMGRSDFINFARRYGWLDPLIGLSNHFLSLDAITATLLQPLWFTQAIFEKIKDLKDKPLKYRTIKDIFKK